MQMHGLPITAVFGCFLLTLVAETVQGGKCQGAWANKHYCFGGNGKRSGPPTAEQKPGSKRYPLSSIIYGGYPKRVAPVPRATTLEKDFSPPVYPYDGGMESLQDNAVYPDYTNSNYPDVPSRQREDEVKQMWQRLIEKKAREIYDEMQQNEQEE